MKKVSIGIITYMRPIGLKKILSSFTSQILEDIELSIIVIDNDGTGENKKVIDELLLENYPYKIDFFIEETRGIVSARNRTVKEFLKTDDESMIFVDDDEWPVHNDWIKKLVEVQESHNADIVYSDVYIIPQTDKIKWVKEAYTSNDYGNKILATKVFYTNNLLVKREVYEDINPPFAMPFSLTGSEDVHFSIKAINRGYKAYYTPYAPVEEIFPITRATLKWFFLRGYRTGEGTTRANMYEQKNIGSFIAHVIYKFLGRFVRGIQMFIKSLFTFKKAYLARGCTYMGATIGTIAGLLGWQYNEYNNIHGK
jgi:glycosyltransferase involved in cell wall biosynthesis